MTSDTERTDVGGDGDGDGDGDASVSAGGVSDEERGGSADAAVSDREGDGGAEADVVDLDHVALRVSNLDAALEFYGGLLGLPTRDRERFDRGEVPYVAVVAGGRHLHLVPTDGDGDGDGSERESEEIEPGQDHVCLLLRSDRTDTREELTDLLDDLRAAGVTVEADEPRKRYGAYGRDWAGYVRDPDGRIVELKMH